jgi:hypothetical protein
MKLQRGRKLKLPWKKEPSVYDEPITDILSVMRQMTPDSEDYPTLVAQLERLNEMKTQERKNQVSRDTLVIVAGGIIQVLVIVVYEQKHVWVSKAVGFIQKAK